MPRGWRQYENVVSLQYEKPIHTGWSSKKPNILGQVKTIQPDTSSITDYLQLKLDLELAFCILIKTKLSLSIKYDNFEQTFPGEC